MDQFPYTVTDGILTTTAMVMVNAAVVNVDLQLKNSGTIVNAPEQDGVAHDVEEANAGTSQLGALPMGQGRAKDLQVKDKVYISPHMVIGTVAPGGGAAANAGITFAWQRYYSDMSWAINKTKDINNNDQWTVTQHDKHGFPNRVVDPIPQNTFDATPSATDKIYIYDNPGEPMPNYTDVAIGGYAVCEIDFLYRVTATLNGQTRVVGQMRVGQTLVARRKASTFLQLAADDWTGISNASNAGGVDLTITQQQVQGYVGAGTPIVIDPNANKRT